MSMLNIYVSALLLLGTGGQEIFSLPVMSTQDNSQQVRQKEVAELDKALGRLKQRLAGERSRAYETRLDAQRLLFRDYLQYRQMVDEAEMYEAQARQTETAIAELCDKRAQLTNGEACPVRTNDTRRRRG